MFSPLVEVFTYILADAFTDEALDRKE